MKERVTKIYICGVCGAEYEKRDLCEQCERTHYSKFKVQNVYWSKQSKHPAYIVLKDDDGRDVVYAKELTCSNIIKNTWVKRDPREWSDLVPLNGVIVDSTPKNQFQQKSFWDKLKDLFGF